MVFLLQWDEKSSYKFIGHNIISPMYVCSNVKLWVKADQDFKTTGSVTEIISVVLILIWKRLKYSTKIYI